MDKAGKLVLLVSSLPCMCRVKETKLFMCVVGVGLCRAVVIAPSLLSHIVPQAIEDEAGPAACNGVPPLAVELMAVEGLCLCVRHSVVFHVLSRKRVSEEITETAKVRRSLSKSADNWTDNAFSNSIFEKDAFKWAAFVRLCAVESSDE